MQLLDYIVDIQIPYGKTSVIPFILVANLPQAIVSFIYLVYNGQFTAMLAHREWSNYAIKRAPLRVTHPSSGQRSTYYLQIPYTFGVPLLASAIVLHWLISQSIFLVRIVVHADGTKTSISQYLDNGRNGDFFSALGYSSSAIVASMAWGLILVVIVLAAAFMGKYPMGLPIGGMNSAVISAACHIQHKERRKRNLSDRPLMWGVTIPGSEETVGHCSFSNDEVDSPKVGLLYAGY